MPADVCFVPLADRPDLREQALLLLLSENPNPKKPEKWGCFGDSSRAPLRDAVPFPVIAVNREDQVVGIATVVPYDLSDYPVSGAWVAGVVVRKDCRGCKIGGGLMRALVDFVRRLVVPAGNWPAASDGTPGKLWLFCEKYPVHAGSTIDLLPDWYARLGWEVVETVVRDNEDKVVMSHVV